MPKFTKYNTHKPQDNLDTGFTLPGFKLRWLQGDYQDRRRWRIWSHLSVADLPEALTKKLQEKFPGMLKDTDRIRYRDLVLAYASLAAVEEERAKIAEENKRNQGVLTGGQSGNVQSKGSVQRSGAGDFQ
jgi:hypothetical protein